MKTTEHVPGDGVAGYFAAFCVKETHQDGEGAAE